MSNNLLNIEYLQKGFYFIKNQSGLKIIENNEIDIEKQVEDKKIKYLNTSQSFKHVYEYNKLNKSSL